MEDILINLIMAKLDILATVAICIPLFGSAVATTLMALDIMLSRFRVYNIFMYGTPTWNIAASEELFSKVFIMVGAANIITPCIVIYIYLFLTDTPFSVFWNSWRT